ncbi:MAG: hypothetical protein AAFP19_22900, partial [Bacteroidota bacterium]
MKRIVIISCLFLIGTTALLAQPITKSNAEKLKKAAEMSMESKDYVNALEFYEELYREEKEQTTAYEIAKLHYELRDYERAERWYGRIVKRKSRKKVNPFLPEARFAYARILKINGKYDECVEQLQLYISEAEDLETIAKAKLELRGAEMAREMDPATGMTVENAGPNLNSPYSEYSPIMANDNQIYFTAIQSNKLIVLDGSEKGDPWSKVYMAQRQGEDGWTEAKAIEGENLNRPGYHIANVTLSPGRGKMYFTRARLEGSEIVECKLYVSVQGKEGWGPANLVAGVNGDYLVQQPAFGELFGNTVLFFSSNMSGGYGGYDLYYSTVNGDEFMPPVNLGNVINSKGNEETPYYLDGKLFFSSDHHPGIG